MKIMEAKNITKKKVGLALGGGGAKGLAHIGVIKELERAGVEISYIAGTSMGALVGAWYAATKDIAALEKLFISIKDEDVYSMSKIARKHDGAIFKDSSIPDFLEKQFKSVDFNDLKIPFKAIATDTKNGEQVVLEKGSLSDAVRASTALPVVFSPVEIDGRVLMDGGFVNPVPADVVREMGANLVIAVDVSSKWFDFSEEKIRIFHIYSLIASALAVIEYQIAARILEENADIVLHPQVLTHHWLEFGNARELIAHGETETHEQISKICEHAGHQLPEKSPFEKFMDFILYA